VSDPALLALVVNGTLAIRVTTKASANRIRIEERSEGGVRVRVDVTTVPEDGKANAAVIKQLAKALGVPKSALAITQGQTARDKLVSIRN
jgi:uncharacterized protein